MVSYPAILNRVVNGCTIDMDVYINPEQTETQRIRLSEIHTANTQKIYHLSFTGAERILAELEVKKWFSERTQTLTVNYITIDLCGRWLSDIVEEITLDSLVDHMKSLNYTDDNWSEVKQEELKDDWFDGELVQIPDGDYLPIFQNWGKQSFAGYNSINFKGCM